MAKENEWGCHACTFLNRNYDCHKCEICETERNEKVSISDHILEPASRKESLVHKIPFAAIETGLAKTGHDNIVVPAVPQINLKPTLLDRYSHGDSLPLAVDEHNTKQPSHNYGSMETHKAETEVTNMGDKTTEFISTPQKRTTLMWIIDASLMSHKIHPQSDVNSTVRGKDKDTGNGKMVISLALLSGCRKDVCYQYIASVLDNATSNDQGTLLAISDLKNLGCIPSQYHVRES